MKYCFVCISELYIGKMVRLEGEPPTDFGNQAFQEIRIFSGSLTLRNDNGVNDIYKNCYLHMFINGGLQNLRITHILLSVRDDYETILNAWVPHTLRKNQVCWTKGEIKYEIKFDHLWSMPPAPVKKLVFTFKFDDLGELLNFWNYVEDCIGGPDSGGSDSKKRKLQYLKTYSINVLMSNIRHAIKWLIVDSILKINMTLFYNFSNISFY